MSTTSSNPYQIFHDLSNAGWKHNFDISVAGNLCIPIEGAPSLGGSTGGYLYFGTYTAPDGTSLIQRSNMDRSVTTILMDPMGSTQVWKDASLIKSAERIEDLDLI